MRLEIRGIQELQAANNKAIAALKPDDVYGRAIVWGAGELHRYAVAITHVDTGSLRASHRMGVNLIGLQGRIYIDTSVSNPRSGRRPAEYGYYEEMRGGEHAFYERTVNERGAYVLERMTQMIAQEIF